LCKYIHIYVYIYVPTNRGRAGLCDGGTIHECVCIHTYIYMYIYIYIYVYLCVELSPDFVMVAQVMNVCAKAAFYGRCTLATIQEVLAYTR